MEGNAGKWEWGKNWEQKESKEKERIKEMLRKVSTSEELKGKKCKGK